MPISNPKKNYNDTSKKYRREIGIGMILFFVSFWQEFEYLLDIACRNKTLIIFLLRNTYSFMIKRTHLFYYKARTIYFIIKYTQIIS